MTDGGERTINSNPTLLLLRLLLLLLFRLRWEEEAGMDKR